MTLAKIPCSSPVFSIHSGAPQAQTVRRPSTAQTFRLGCSGCVTYLITATALRCSLPIMFLRARSGVVLFSAVLSACAASGGSQSTSNETYQEYTCPDPIGKIVREDCSRIALSYEGDNVEGSVGVGSI